ncbi:Protein phosphatase 1H like protein [Argiope bruennichi]|uniref:Protein phosphatase 1H like protein n=1 Tax=Argiope bruennichi TaxID=94029 RepID=A0A8T0ECC6_ARGBR|nr:Protein phosphatase 1H like protein [Argiope bruennichi]
MNVVVSVFVESIKDGEYSNRPPLKFRYARPTFLQLTSDDEVQVSADHIIRPIIVPRDITKLPWNSGYAEAINAGKSVRNEDQAATIRGHLYPSKTTSIKTEVQESIEVKVSPPEDTKPIENGPEIATETELNNLADGNDSAGLRNTSVPEDPKFTTPPSTPEPLRKTEIGHTIPWIYFALFDGHAGSGVAVAASSTLHEIVKAKLQEVADLLELPDDELNLMAKGSHERSSQPAGFQGFSNDRDVTVDSLIVGALESAFWEMDRLIANDKRQYTMTGGCTALVAVFMFGKLYVANAGDSRAVICRGTKTFPMSNDFTPETERNRIRKLGHLRPELLGGEFTHLEFVRRPARKDLGEKILYRDAFMSGWSYKSISMEDLKFPLIYGEGKRSRVLATIGVTRGFGDHDLKALNTDVDIKPFLSSEPEVKIFNLLEEELTDGDVLIMGTDGLWDVTTNEKAAEVVQKSLDHFPANDAQRYKYRYTSAAQDLVMHARGKLRDRNWRTADNKYATIDDISVFVIPLRPYKDEYCQLNAKKNPLRH